MIEKFEKVCFGFIMILAVLMCLGAVILMGYLVVSVFTQGRM